MENGTSPMIPLAKRSKKSDDDGKDVISQLPDHILISIISLLTMKEAVKSSILSRRWRYLWTYHPRLDFDASNTLNEFLHVHRKFRKLNIKRVSYVNWVNQVLLPYNGLCIKVLRIRFDLGLKWGDEVDRWVQFAMERNVSIFELNLWWPHCLYPTRKLYTFPSLPFVGFSWHVSLTVLKLRVNVCGDVLEYILGNCVSLETLSVFFSKSLINLRVTNSSRNLKHLELHSCHQLKTLQVSAPNLVSFHYSGPIISMPLENTPKLKEILLNGEYGRHMQFNMFDLSHYCSQLRKLTLTVYAHVLFFGNFPRAEYPLFNNLKELVLVLTYGDGEECLLGMTSLIKQSPFLQKFCLELNASEYEEKREILEVEKWELEHIKVVEVIDFMEWPVDMEVVLFFTKNAVALEKLVLDTRYHDIDGNTFLMTSKKKTQARKRRARRLKPIIPQGVELLIY